MNGREGERERDIYRSVRPWHCPTLSARSTYGFANYHGGGERSEHLRIKGWKFLAEFRLLVQRPSFTTDRIFFPFFFRIGRKRIGGIRMEGIRRWFREGDISSPEGKFEKVGSQIFEFGIFESIHAASSRSTLFPWLLSVGNANV